MVILLNVFTVFLCSLIYRYYTKLPQGVELNKFAWEASYSERQLDVPSKGPREGYNGYRLWKYTVSLPFGRLAVNVMSPRLFAYDKLGRQYYQCEHANCKNLLILGGSVAGGAYASEIKKTYFNILGETLAQKSCACHITVMSGGGWTSENEIPTLKVLLGEKRYDVVMFLDGLNDLTELKDRYMEQRIHTYLHNMQEALDLNSSKGIITVFALQPFLPDKIHKSRIEKRIIKLYRVDKLLGTSFHRIKAGLKKLSNQENAYYIDCSDVLNNERVTTFADLWHFSDYGHVLLAQKLAGHLVPVLNTNQSVP